MELSQLYQFREIALLENMTRAAEKLYVSQPALSKSMRQLEQEVGLQLFDRRKNRIALNQTGEEFLERVNAVLASMDELHQFCENRKKSERPLRFVASDERAYRHLIPSIAKHYPDLEITSSVVEEHLLFETLINHQSAAAITTSITNDPRLVSLPLFTEHACVVVPVGHPLFEKESLTLKDLNGETLIFSRGNEAEAARTTRGYKRLGVSIKTVFAESWMIHANASHTTKYLIGASNISLKYLPSNPSSRVLPIIDDIPNLTTYHFYFVFSKTCRSMGELYLKLKALL